jgi:hypothetical protein
LVRTINLEESADGVYAEFKESLFDEEGEKGRIDDFVESDDIEVEIGDGKIVHVDSERCISLYIQSVFHRHQEICIE